MEGARYMPELTDEHASATEHEGERQRKRKRNIYIFFGVSLLNLVIFALIWTQLLTPAQHSSSDLLIGRTAPGFTLAMLQPPPGKSTLSLTDYKGKALVLNFWASWCEP